MWYGEDTPELVSYKEQYRKIFGVSPDGEMELEYGPEDYNDYLKDIKKAIRIKKTLPNFV